MISPPPIPDVAVASRCPQCGTAIPPTAVSCQACHALIYTDRLKTLAAAARAAADRGDVSGELEAWRNALEWLPRESSQYRSIAGKVQALSRSLSDPSAAPAAAPGGGEGKKAWSGGAIGAGALLLWKFKAVGLFLLTKGKLLLFGLSKGTTFFSMLAAISVYWTIWGWKFALGFVLSIYIHEMGHVAAMKRFGLAATPPMFIPGFGAFIRMKQHPATVQEEARIGLGGPIWGLSAAAACFLIYQATAEPFWAALTHTGAMINLFNLMPIWGLDGDHAFKALNRTERWIATGVAGGMLLLTGEGLLVLIAILAGVQAFREAPNTEGDRTALIQFAGLVVALALLMKMPVPGLP
ncbi:MAG: site-2 protease family protein [Vicinamibacteraceae bacterium]